MDRDAFLRSAASYLYRGRDEFLRLLDAHSPGFASPKLRMSLEKRGTAVGGLVEDAYDQGLKGAELLEADREFLRTYVAVAVEHRVAAMNPSPKDYVAWWPSGRGRPRLYEGKGAPLLQLRVTPELKARVEARGADWAREVLTRALDAPQAGDAAGGEEV